MYWPWGNVYGSVYMKISSVQYFVFDIALSFMFHLILLEPQYGVHNIISIAQLRKYSETERPAFLWVPKPILFQFHKLLLAWQS